MNDISYIFGAGASCKAMPLVVDFARRYEVFSELITKDRSYPAELQQAVEAFELDIKAHATFDTLFKKLFHQQNTDELIVKYKNVLLLYFLFEHLVILNDFHHQNIQYRQQKIDGVEKKATMDPRYEALIAALLKPIRSKTEFYTNVNFLTWNYDANLLFALKNFISPDEPFSNFVNSRLKGDYFEISPQVKLFHLNGFIFHPVLDFFTKPDSFQSFKNLCIANKFDLSSTLYIDKLKFAWEQKQSNLNQIRDCISKSRNILLIGYSLPLYNRQTDSAIFEYTLMLKKNLYIQDLKPLDNISILDSDFGIRADLNNSNGDLPKIISSDNCNSFIVPRSVLK